MVIVYKLSFMWIMGIDILWVGIEMSIVGICLNCGDGY